MSEDESPEGMGTAATGTTPGRRRNMQAIRRTDTKPEVRLRSALHRAGLRFRKDMRLDLPGARVRPDIVFTRAKVAVFVDGCFWHSCPEHGHQPSQNVGYWAPKLQRTINRDNRDTSYLTDAGWAVLRIWEHVPVDVAVAQIVECIRGYLAETEPRPPSVYDSHRKDQTAT